MLITALAFKDLITYVHFQYNRDFIAENFCININTPEVMCSGTCYLQSSLEESHDQQTEWPNPITEEKVNLDYLLSVDENRDLTVFSNIQIESYFVVNNYSHSYLKDVFHPPRFTC